MKDWSIERALHTYSIPHWSEGYVDVDAKGRVAAVGPGVRAAVRTGVHARRMGEFQGDAPWRWH